MGNQLAGVSTELNSIADLQEGLVQKSELGGGKGRLLKGLHCESEEGQWVVKVYLKRDQADNTELKKASKQLKAVEGRLAAHVQQARAAGRRSTNVCGYTRIQESDKAGWLTRRYFYQSLAERIVTRPFMPNVTKRWCAFQLLKAVQELHTAGVAHGDLKAENVMTSSLGWLYLVDIAPFKPTYIKHDNPADFSFYFDTTEQHHCYLAPERFYDPKEGTPDCDAPVTEKMDLFAVGCIIAQLCLDGDVLFNLPDLLAYRKGTLDPFQLIEARVEDPDVKGLLRHMLQMDPAQRFPAREYLAHWTPKVFPNYFEMFFTNIIGSGLIHCSPDERMYILYSRFDDILEAIRATRPPADDRARQDVQEGLTLLAQTLTASIRHCRLSESKLLGLHVVDRMADYVTDDTRLQWLLPHTVALLSDIGPLVRAKAVQSIALIVSRAQSFPPSEAALFEEYIMPALSRIPRDPSEHVRAAYAALLPEIASHAWRFLETRQLINRSLHTSADGVASKGGFDADAAELQELYQALLQDLQRPTGDLRRSSLVCRALLHDITKLCTVLGIARTNDFVLPMLTTFLNSRDAQFRCQLSKQLVSVACYVGPTALHNFILPCMEQGMNDVEEIVVAEAVTGLANLCTVGMFSRESTVTVSRQVFPLLLHPNSWIRQAAMNFALSAATKLSPLDVLCHLLPVLKPFLRYPIVVVDRESLPPCIHGPVSRHAFDRAMRTAMATDKAPAPGFLARPRSTSLISTATPTRPYGRFDTDSIPPTSPRPIPGPAGGGIPSRQGSSTDLWDAADRKDGLSRDRSPARSSPLPAEGDRLVPVDPIPDARGAVLDKTDEFKLQLMQDYILRTAAYTASKKREWGGMSLGSPGSGEGIQQHDLSDYKNALLTVSRPRPPAEVIDDQRDPMAVAIAQVASQRHYCLSLHPIIVRPTARQMRRLALRYLYPDVAGRERRPQQSIGRAVSIVESTDGAVTGLLAPYDPAAGSDTPHEETFPRCFSEASLAPERPVSGFTAACPRYPGSPALKPAASPSFAQGPASTSFVDKCQTPLAPPAASHLNSVRPSSPLLCQAKEHDGAVLDSAAHELLPIFLTAGADGTLRLWDLRQLDNESALVSRKVYSTQSTPARRMLSCCLQSSLASSAAAGNDEGAFSLFDLSTGTELYRQIVGGGVGGGVSCIRRVTGCDTFLCGSHHGIVCAVDPRVARGEVWSSPPDTRQGPLTGLVLGDESGRGCAVWMVTATLRGHATLWDLRFRIPVYTWQHPQDSPALYALGLCGPAPTVLMAANNNEVPRWNLESLRCQAIYKASPASPSGSDPRDARRSSPAPSSSTTNPFCPPLTSATHTHSIRAICGFRDCNWFITGGTDRKIRFWDTSNPCHSYTVSGLEPGEPQPKFQETRVQGTTEIREQPLQVGEEDLRKARGQHPTSTLNRNVTAHKDCITSLTLVCPMPQTNIPLLASSSRDGVVKIWQNRVMQMQDRR